MLWAVHFLASLGSGIASLAFPVFPGVTWQWRSIIGIPCVSLSVPSVFCSVLVAFPSWLAMFVVPACWLACFMARRSAGARGFMYMHSHDRQTDMFMPV